MTEFAEFDEPFEPVTVNGLDYRKRIIYDPSAMYWKEVEEHGIWVTCETCGKTWKTHPVNAGRVFACTSACRMKGLRARRRGEGSRRLYPMTHRPWEHIGKKDS